MSNSIWNEFKKPSNKLNIIVAICGIVLAGFYTSLVRNQGIPTYSVQQAIVFDQSKINNDMSNVQKDITIVNKEGSRIDKTYMLQR